MTKTLFVPFFNSVVAAIPLTKEFVDRTQLRANLVDTVHRTDGDLVYISFGITASIGEHYIQFAQQLGELSNEPIIVEADVNLSGTRDNAALHVSSGGLARIFCLGSVTNWFPLSLILKPQ